MLPWECSGAAGTTAAPHAWPGDHRARTTSTLLLDRVSTGVVVARTLPRGSVMPRLCHEKRWDGEWGVCGGGQPHGSLSV